MSALVEPVLDEQAGLSTAGASPVPMDTSAPDGERRSVQRTALLAELLSLDSTTLVTLCAPPGYGKSTLLAQWAEADPRPFPWLTLTSAHNDRARLLSDLAAATVALRNGTASLRVPAGFHPNSAHR